MKQLNLFSSIKENPRDIQSESVDEIGLENELIRKICQGLSAEWKFAVKSIDPLYQNLLNLPLFSIKDMTSRLGYWAKHKHEICLSKNLVLNHPWDAVREVLFHEMAHQMADRVFGFADESPHGPGFQEACKLLRANPQASGRYPTLDERFAYDKDTAADTQLRRIKKLMALAKSRNRHEAQSAMLKAHQLIKKYNIDIMQQNETREYLSIFLGTPLLRHTRDHYHLAVLLQHFYFVEGIWVSAYVMDKNKMGRVLEITGTRPNIKMASYVYYFVRRFIQSQWESYNQNKQHTMHRKIDFSVGIIEGFKSKLEKDEKTNVSVKESSALVKVEDLQLKKHMDYKYPHTRSFSRSTGFQNDNVVSDGIAIGKNLVISKVISGKGKSGKLLPK